LTKLLINKLFIGDLAEWQHSIKRLA